MVMGLDVAEIAMDMEDCFCVRIEENADIGPRVIDWEDYIFSNFDTNTLPTITDIKNIINGSERINKKQYKKIRTLMPSLPSRLFSVPHAYTYPDAIIEHHRQWMTEMGDESAIREKVRCIIKERLCLDFEILSEHDLFKDLGAG